jgi:hypothetical protein
LSGYYHTIFHLKHFDFLFQQGCMKKEFLISGLLIAAFMTCAMPVYAGDESYNLERFNADTFKEGRGMDAVQNLGYKLDVGAAYAIKTGISEKGQCEAACPVTHVPATAPATTADFSRIATAIPGDPHLVNSFSRKPVGYLPGNPHLVNNAPLPGAPKLVNKFKRKVKSLDVLPGDPHLVVDVPETCFKECYKSAIDQCMDVFNTSGVSLFIPNKTPEEFSSFFHNLPPGILVSPCELRYTAWVPDQKIVIAPEDKDPITVDTICAKLDMACNAADITVTLNRTCQLSLGTDMDAASCAADERLDINDRALGLLHKVVCKAPTAATHPEKCGK